MANVLGTSSLFLMTSVTISPSCRLLVSVWAGFGQRPEHWLPGRTMPSVLHSYPLSSRALGCPSFPLARSIIWAKENGYLDAVTAAVNPAGKSLEKEVHDLDVSPLIAKALLEVDASLGDSIKDVRELLTAQFPPTTKDVTDEEMFDVMSDVLRLQSSSEGKLPLTLIVLDEMQQYIGEDHEKALAVQNIVEGCSSRFESQVLFVATGQSSLTATPTLQKLTDRFAVQVALSDKDVESVVRQVILRKQPAQIPTLKSTVKSTGPARPAMATGISLPSTSRAKALRTTQQVNATSAIARQWTSR